MSSSLVALRRAIHARLVTDAALLALLGGPHVHDDPPRNAPGPFIVHGDLEARDASSGTEAGFEQVFDLVIWAARQGETGHALAIAERVDGLLHEAALPLVGHRLINLRRLGLTARRDERSGRVRLSLRLRAVTEPL